MINYTYLKLKFQGMICLINQEGFKNTDILKQARLFLLIIIGSDSLHEMLEIIKNTVLKENPPLRCQKHFLIQKDNFLY